MINSLVFFVLFFAMFGPKVGGVVDLMVLVPAFLVALFLSKYNVSFPDKVFSPLMGVLLLLSLWIVFSCFINNAEDFRGALRIVRAILSFLVLFPFLYFVASRSLITEAMALRLLVVVLALNSLAIYSQIAFPAIQGLLAPLYGFDKTIRSTRAFGLTAGYDSAGYLIALLSSIMLSISLIFRSWAYFIGFIVVFVSIVFTSRTSMLLGFLLITFTMFLLRKELFKNATKVGIGLVGVTIGVGWYALLLILSSLPELGQVWQLDNASYETEFATTEVAGVLSIMGVMPRELSTWIMGTGAIITWSDIGYIKTLYLGGVPLLLCFLWFYLYLYSLGRHAVLHKRLLKGGKIINDERWSQLWLIILFLMILVMIISNFKNLYFFTRGYHEIFVIIVALVLGFYRVNNR
jgi:hypothetical protein